MVPIRSASPFITYKEFLYHIYYRKFCIYAKMVVLIATPYFNDGGAKKKATVMCANCGGYGHLYKSCNHPVISYGIICYRIEDSEIKFLMVQRKDSLSYVEFIRGKYASQNRVYIMKLFMHMTEDERARIATYDFDTLWKTMWCKTENETNKNFTKEYAEAEEKFNMLKHGYMLKCSDSDNIIKFSLEYILQNTSAMYSETEWGFPKGRRNINEDDVSCAIREFKEESGILPKCIRLCTDIKPIEEVFSGSNKIRYKHVYYIAKYVFDQNIPHNVCKEIKAVEWFTIDEILDKIRPHNVERKELVKRIYNTLQRRFYR